MSKNILLWALFLSVTVRADFNTVCKLTVVDHPISELDDTSVDLSPAAYSSPIDNLNNHIFNVFRADPVDACVKIKDPELDWPLYMRDNPFLVAIDGEAGGCGFKRRVQIAKDVGAKGVIIVDKNMDHAMDPYGDFSDSTFLVFFAEGVFARDLLLGSDYFVGSLTSTNKVPTNNEVELWLSAMNEKSYQLMKYWSETLKEIPAIAQKVNWKPRYAVWSCYSGSTFSDTCTSKPEYLSSCACRGQFCSPENQDQSADAIIKEDIRQKLIFQHYPNKFDLYTLNFKKQCFEIFKKNNYVEDCAHNIMNSVGIDGRKVQKDVDSFVTGCQGDLYESFVLDRNRFGQLGYYPAILVNRMPIEFSSKNKLQDQLCRKLSLQKADGCAQAIRTRIIINTTVGILSFVLIAGGLGAVATFLVLWYRKSLRKDLQKEAKMQVSASVEHYFALTEAK